MIVDLITNRTISDVTYAAANRDSEIPLKGAYNAEDFNRVGEALNYLSDWLFALGYGLNPQLRTDWTPIENMSYGDAAHYLDTIKQVKESFFVLPETPPLPGHVHELFNSGGHEKANDIEKVLLDIEHMILLNVRNINLGWVINIAHIGLYGGL